MIDRAAIEKDVEEAVAALMAAEPPCSFAIDVHLDRANYWEDFQETCRELERIERGLESRGLRVWKQIDGWSSDDPPVIYYGPSLFRLYGGAEAGPDGFVPDAAIFYVARDAPPTSFRPGGAKRPKMRLLPPA